METKNLFIPGVDVVHNLILLSAPKNKEAISTFTKALL